MENSNNKNSDGLLKKIRHGDKKAFRKRFYNAF